MSATSAAVAWSLGIDDTVEAIRARLRDYHAKTRRVLDLFRAKGLVAVDTTHPAEHVQAELRRRLGVG